MVELCSKGERAFLATHAFFSRSKHIPVIVGRVEKNLKWGNVISIMNAGEVVVSFTVVRIELNGQLKESAKVGQIVGVALLGTSVGELKEFGCSTQNPSIQRVLRELNNAETSHNTGRQSFSPPYVYQ